MSVERIILLGINHTTAPVEVRERLACADNQEAVFSGLHASDACEEYLFLSTCNRVEVLARGSDLDETCQEIVRILFSEKLTTAETEQCLYRLQGEKAVEHLFRVGAGLDSMVMGEPQILGQLKDAFRTAVERNTLGTVLHRLVNRAFSVAKRIRTETAIGSHAVSISYAAVELAKKIFGDLQEKRAMLVGAGEMAELAANHLKAHGVKEIVVANRTLERAVDLARCFNGIPVGLDELHQQLVEVDICISSTGSPSIILEQAAVKEIMRRRHGRPLFLIDIAVPRDLDPTIDGIDNVYLYDIDDLQQVVEKNRKSREGEAVKAERIVREEVIKFRGWLDGLAITPVITDLRKKAGAICAAELQRTLPKMPHLEDKDHQDLEKMVAAITQKLLHHPICYAKNGNSDTPERLALLRQVFGLDND